ncbi:MAG: phospholipid carrier-dependent glycosyltransferase [Leptolyngbya sp. SIO4C1]|nr:phospholipid carrier-dependent glycosyltransferase [Leptolyngbya sp. SIO4C1]
MSKLTARWAGVGLAGLLLIAGLLRFWQLGQFNTLVFDEAHFAKFAYQYWQHQPVFDVHPPLGKYLIAAGLWLGQPLAELAALPMHEQLGQPLAAISYRWVSALIGTLTPPVVAGIAWQISAGSPLLQRQLFALLAGSFVAIDGLFVVESRYALINIHLVFWGCLSHWLWLRGAGRDRALAGLALGASLATKWSGLPFILGLLIHDCHADTLYSNMRSVWSRMWNKGWTRGLLLVALPLLTYGLLWLPHLQTSPGLWRIHQQILRFHLQLDSAAHAYCSPWYSWPLLLRPVAYWYEKAANGLYYDVHGLGNPVLWWLSVGALVALVTGLRLEGQRCSRYILLNYALSWLPWALVSRCTFLYHYLPAAVFGFLALAWLLSQWLISPRRAWRLAAIAMLIAIAAAFWFWLPVQLGLPLSQAELRSRFWLNSWQ